MKAHRDMTRRRVKKIKTPDVNNALKVPGEFTIFSGNKFLSQTTSTNRGKSSLETARYKKKKMDRRGMTPPALFQEHDLLTQIQKISKSLRYPYMAVPTPV
jgi:hypothetical protein